MLEKLTDSDHEILLPSRGRINGSEFPATPRACLKPSGVLSYGHVNNPCTVGYLDQCRRSVE